MIYLTCQFLLQMFSCENKQLRRKNNATEANPRQHVSKSTRLGQSHPRLLTLEYPGESSMVAL